eukprot:COSAG02_NODE_53887_length_299_cov_0.770000_1_plen_52_part_10
MLVAVASALGAAVWADTTNTCIDESGKSGPCMPGHEFCGQPFAKDTSRTRPS